MPNECIVKINRDGALGITEASANEVIFSAANINSPADSQSLYAAVKAKFKGDVEFWRGSGSGHYFDFTRPLQEPLRNKRAFLISTQRKLIEILEEFEARHIENSLL